MKDASITRGGGAIALITQAVITRACALFHGSLSHFGIFTRLLAIHLRGMADSPMISVS